MKYFNQKKINWKIIKVIESIANPISFLLNKLKKKMRIDDGNQYILLIDGFLIGDTVLLRPLIREMVKKYCETHKIIIIAGHHARYIFADLSDKIELIEYQFPWAIYNYSLANLTHLLKIWLNLYKRSIDICIETRGDFRNILWGSLICPNRLIGFDFTGGHKLLTDVITDDGKIMHLFEHVKKIGAFCGCDLSSVEDITFENYSNSNKSTVIKRIGISFSGSQPLKTLPVEIGLNIITRLIEETDIEIWYIMSPQERCLSTDVLKRKFGSKVEIFSGDFGIYFDFLKTIQLYIGMDSAGGHLCALLGIPSIIIYGTQEAWYCKPISKQTLGVETKEEMTCRPCDGVHCINDTYQRCLHTIDINEIINGVSNA